jgi:hypothetical protein
MSEFPLEEWLMIFVNSLKIKILNLKFSLQEINIKI